jgi:putative ABC transport system permease protein
VLTVVVGVLAISGLGVFGLAFEASQQRTLGDIANEVEVVPPTEQPLVALEADGDVPGLTQQRLETVERVAGDAPVTALRDVSPPNASGSRVVSLSAMGVTNLPATYEVIRGEVPENWESGAVVDRRTASFNDIEIGDPVQAGGRLQTVVAVVEGKRATDFGGVGLTSYEVLLPMYLVEPADGTAADYTGAIVQAEDAVEANAVARELRARLNDDLPEDTRFEVRYQAESAASIGQQFRLTGQFLLVIGGVSVLLAGISITNVQLMSARERRTEVGVLRAVGFGQTDILLVMLIEATIMGAVAAVVGTALSVVAGGAVSGLLLGTPLAFQPGTGRFLLLGAVFAVGVCLLAGVYPAWRASRERPVDALRS